MEPSVQKTASLLLGIGSVFFILAAFMPCSRVFIEPNPAKKMIIINEMQSIWNLAHVFFPLGSLLTVFAIGMIIYNVNSVSGIKLAYVGELILCIGAILWTWHTIERITNPEGFAYGKNTPYLFVIFSFLTQIGLILFGLFILKSEIPHWIGLMFVVGASLFLVLMIIFKDMPPLVYYVLTLVAAISMFVQAHKTILP